jgi:proteasome lid subunit RPN8/RPN11
MAKNRKRDRKAASERSRHPSQVIIDPGAHRDIRAHCAENPSQEVCGVLVGFTWPEGGMQRTRVVGSVRGAHARQDQMSVTFTHDTWQAVHEAIERRTDGARVVGWYHSHPDFGVFYSSQDAFIHRHFFGDVGQLGLVIDPVRGQCGAFLSTAAGIDPIRRFEVARQNSTGHLVSCAYAPESIQESAPEAMAAAGDDSAVLGRLDSMEATAARVERSVRSVRTGVMVACALLVVIAAFAVLGWILPPPALVLERSRPGAPVLIGPSQASTRAGSAGVPPKGAEAPASQSDASAPVPSTTAPSGAKGGKP